MAGVVWAGWAEAEQVLRSGLGDVRERGTGRRPAGRRQRRHAPRHDPHLSHQGRQTARDFSAAAPLVNVALTGNARLTATMSVTPRPCVSLRRHGHLDATLATLEHLGTIDATLAAFLAAAVRSRCNIIVTGGVDAGMTTF